MTRGALAELKHSAACSLRRRLETVPAVNTLPPGHHYGNVLRQVEAPDVLLTEIRDRRGEGLPTHRHEAAHLCFIVGGDYVAFDKGVPRRHPSRSLLFYPAGATHRDQIHPGGGACLAIELLPPLQDELGLEAYAARGRVVASEPTASRAAMRLWHEMRCTRRSSPRDVRDLTLAVMRLLLDEIRLRPPASPWLRDVRATIAANPAAPLGLKRLADQAGVHPGHLTRAFRASYGMTPRSYQRRCRIDLACRALGESLTPLAEIAIDVGYAEQSSFTRSFQQMTGMTPLSFRRQARLDSAERDVRFGQDTDSTLQ